MAQEIINVGTSANDGTGDALRNAFIKSNNNFTELYANRISGSGTDNYIPRFNGTNALENSIIFDNGTNVGIGTTSAWFPASGRRVLSINGTNSSLLEFQKSGVLSGYIYSTDSVFEFSGGDSAPLLFLTSNTERMRITSSGNVGIGTSAPNIGGWGKAVTLQGAGNAAFEVTDGTVRTSLIAAAGSAGYVSTDTDHPLLFRTNSSERMRITNTGNVGIGTSSPIGKLSIVGSGVGSGILDFNTDSTRCDIQSYNKPLAINRQGNNTLLNEESGKVGIGTTAPTSKLHVVGLPSYADNTTALAGGLTAGAFYHTAGVLKVVI